MRALSLTSLLILSGSQIIQKLRLRRLPAHSSRLSEFGYFTRNGQSQTKSRNLCTISTSEGSDKDTVSRTTNTNTNIMRVLNVAEKNDAAKRIAGLLSNGSAQLRNGPAKFNKIYEFPFQLMGRTCQMVMTSVSGHLLTFDFNDNIRSWQSVDPVVLFDAPVVKKCPESYLDCKRNLEKEAAYAQFLIIWTDCDREGENIGFEIIDVCKAINPRLTVYRAKFSEITPTAVHRAVNNLIQPNKAVSDAVDTRSELDLRIGAAFTRFQTMRLQRKFPNSLRERLISYGSCQFPTLGFVVERYKAIQEFVPEDFWKIEVSHTVEHASVDFHWARVRLFNELACRALFEKCKDNPTAKVTKVVSKPKSKWRPVAMDTIEFEKLASRKLRISAKEAMKIAEKLYTAGNISYPRTETNIFPKGLNLVPLIEMQISDAVPWGGFAQRLAVAGPNPRNGKKSDQAHPPIHPTKLVTDLFGNEARIYELIVRHFLACCSKDALGTETTVDIDIAEEKFVANGLIILERNYLEVYPYDRWSDKELPKFEQGQTFVPTKIEMAESETSPPNLLTEADLISLMEKHGIGTDATHAEHIETIKSRMYVGVQGDGRFVPGQLGMGLVEGYDSMGFQMSKPNLRSSLEADLKRICDGVRAPDVVLREQIANYKAVFIETMQQVNKLDDAVSHFLNENPVGGGGGSQGGGGGGRSGPGGPYGRGPGPNDEDDDNHGGGGGGGGSSSSRPTSASAMSQGSSTYGRSNENPGPTCFCDSRPNIRTVRNDGPNKGRLFYKCDICGFFEWHEQEGSTASDTSTQGQGSVPSRPASVPSGASSSRPASTVSGQMRVLDYFAPASAVASSSVPVAAVQPNNYHNRMPPQAPASRVEGQGQKPSTFTVPWKGHVQTQTQTQPRAQAAPKVEIEEDDEEESGIPMCHCGERASSLQVRKDNENHGRHFFSCGKGMSGGGCGFFKWDDAKIGPKLKKLKGGGGGQSSMSNRGRSGRGGQGSRYQRGGSSRGGRRGRGGRYRQGQGQASPSSPSSDHADDPEWTEVRRPRRCGGCGQPGHTRRACPLRDFADEEQISMDGVF